MKYNPALDGIRALAVLAVIGCHTMVPGMDAGRWGVDIFFVLSGFLITSLLKAEAESGGIRLGAFYIRRARRLYPALLTMLAGYVLLFPLVGHQPGRSALLAALYLSDYAVAFAARTGFDTAISHTWSLSVEEHFYLLWPLVVMGLTRLKDRRAVLGVLVAAYIVSTAWRLWATHAAGDLWWVTAYRFDTRMSGLILGAILAYLPRLPSPSNAAIPLALAALTYRLTGNAADSVPIIAAEWTGAALVGWAMSGNARALSLPWLAYIGRLSYGLYLFHWPIAYQLKEWGVPWTQTLPITLAVAFLLSHYSLKYIEAPFRRQRLGNAEVGGVKLAV